MRIQVNGRWYDVHPKPGEMLVDVLREHLGLTGTKVGCREAECGACTVWIDGEPILSCVYPAEKAAGKSIVTVEGLAEQVPPEQRVPIRVAPDREEWLHPLQAAFVEHGATQCGFCTPGFLMTGAALLKENPDPSREDIREAFKDNLCRCGAYLAIERAVQAAAKALRERTRPEAPQIPFSVQSLYAVGTYRPRPDAVDKVTGRARYTDDLHFPGMLHAAVRRARVPHGIVRKVDVSRAKAMPGVVAILTAEDLPAAKTHGLIQSDWPILIGEGERVRYVGDAIAIVAAETREQALAAAEAIDVEIEPLPPITDPVEALKPEAPALHPGGNLLKHIGVRKGDIDQGFAEADVILEHTFTTPPYEHAFLEPECSVARLTEDGRMEVYVGSQIPYSDRAQVAAALGWPEERVHIVGQTMGGGFGGKEDIAGQIHAALLAWKTGRPVKLLFDRKESIWVHPKRHATQIRIKLGAKKDGTLVAAQTELYGDTGAYASLGEKVMARAATHSTGPYEIPHVRIDCYAVYTNNIPAGAFRGFGALQSQYVVESAMDMLAERLGLDPIELRKKNALRVGSVTNTGQVLRESVGLLRCIDAVERQLKKYMDEEGVPREAWFKPRVDGEWVKSWGVAIAYKNTGLGGGADDKAAADVELYDDGTLEVRTSSAELGQGLVHVLQLIVAEEFRTPPEQVRVLVMDTDRTPDGGPTTASRQTFVSGNAARYAAQTLKQAITAVLAEAYDQKPEDIRFEDGRVIVGDRTLSLQDVARHMREAGREPMVRYEYHAPATRPLGQGGDMHFAFSFAAQAVEVAVHTRTGEVKVTRAISAIDAGKAISPLGLWGQIEGGVIMGVGHALTERFVVEDGVPITDSFARYRTPHFADVPLEIVPIVVEDPVSTGRRASARS